VLVQVALAPGGRAVVEPYPHVEFVPADRGVLAQVLAAPESVLMREVPAGGFADPLAPESLARREVMGVPVTCDAGGERGCHGVILLFDRVDSGRAGQLAAFGSEEVQVALSFASMLGAVLGARMTAELGKELSLAQAIQGQILPASQLSVPGFELAGDYRTSGKVGGDYFDYVPLADGRTFVVVADVSGHNLASGMMMVSARATLRTLAAFRSDPAQLFEDLATNMYRDLTRTERFLTAAGVALRPNDGSIEVINAGHNELMLCRAHDRRIERFAAVHTILGLLEHPGYAVQHLQMAPDDVLLLYTDGVTEATNDAGEMFGEDRLAAVLSATAARGARAVIEAVLVELREFRGRRPSGDDVTVVAIRALPDGERS
jgi:hypothetical protein